MISKKKLRERLIDICNGAGYYWETDEDLEVSYFDPQNGNTLKTVGSLIHSIERSFDLPLDTRIRWPLHLEEYKDLDRLTKLVYDAIKYDKGDEDE